MPWTLDTWLSEMIFSARKRLHPASAFLGLWLACFVACAMPAAAQVPPAESALKLRLDALAKQGGVLPGGISIAAVELLPKLYASLGYNLAWTNPANVSALKEAVARSWEDGLLPSDFHARFLRTGPHPAATGAGAIDQDILMSDALARLLYQLYFGKVNPNALDANWNFARPMLSNDPVDLVKETLAQGQIGALIAKARLDHPLYIALKSTLQAFTQFEITGGWPVLPDGPAVKPGMSDARMPLLRQRLAVTGEFQGDRADPSPVLDAPLADALKLFQTQHGLDSDGVLGATTLAALNVSAHDRVEQIRVNLERGRWILRPIGPEMVTVNIAGQYLHLIFNGKRVWTTRVVVGKTYNKTPIFTETMKQIVLNPDWTVPRSIVRNEMFPKASANPGYLAANDFYLTGANGPVDASTVDWGGLTASTFPYGIVQRPGPKNALGRVKFLFPNKYSVYLHDTPSRQLFAKAERSLSHGCIRVEDPLKLAELILNERLQWTREKIDAALATGKQQYISLPKPLPVLLLYWTVDPTFDGGAYFYRDIYGRDANVLKALNSEFSKVSGPVAVRKPKPTVKKSQAPEGPAPDVIP